MRDSSTPALLIALAVLASLASGILPAGPLPTSPAGYLDAAFFLLAVWVAVVLPSLGRATPLQVLEVSIGAAPFLLFGARAAPVTPSLPVAGLALAVCVGLIATAASKPVRSSIAILAACVLGLVPLLSSAGMRAVPPGVAAWVSGEGERRLPAVDGTQIAAADLVPEAWRSNDGAGKRRPGSLAWIPAETAGIPIGPPTAGARIEWMAVPAEARADLPVRGPVVLVLGTRLAAGRVGPEPDRSADGDATYVSSASLPSHPFDLEPYDAMLLLPRVEPVGGPEDVAAAEAITAFARRGGLLIGPVHPPSWPLGLDRRLGEAGASVGRGPEGAKAFGIGRLARAESPSDVTAILEAGLAQPRVSTVFDRAVLPPASPFGWERWKDDPDSRKGSAPLLLVYAAAVAAAGLLRGVRRGVALTALAVISCVGLVLVSDRPVGVKATAFVMNVGGGGGRQIEGLFLSASPDGWIEDGPLQAKGGLRVLGFEVLRDGSKGRLALPPGGEGWIVSETIGGGALVPPFETQEIPAWAATLVRVHDGHPADYRIRTGSLPYSGPLVGGIGPLPAARGLAIEPQVP